ncbi:hypothetical protein NDN08_005298 [Rhodosorus marinus]|uniref:Putative rRNA methyltransferase n=1 Tax=Rhodosorus marinus TaxID=101924 RepID=A0AAV8V3M3_9RHOD|nr:hypothetical protein NDN08_005298 [Rhodosorus marinus]
MGKKGKVGKNRKDKFYQLAKEQGFRSRASFKLVQLNKRYDFLSGAARGVLDLCAAPGGWLQVARKYIPLSAPCIGVDLVPIRPIPNVISVTEDITKDACRTALRRELKEHPGSYGDGKVDVVLNDGSPNMGTSWLQDAYTQADLTLSALRLATEFLVKGGGFVTKVFRSNDYNTLLYVMNQFFANVRATKPTASRAESAEIYVVCTGYKAPKRIDPQLLDPKTVFKTMEIKESTERPRLPDNTKKNRNREGYEDGVSTLFRKCSVADFVRTDEALEFLNKYTEFEFDEQNEDVAFISALHETDDEVRAACADLKVLSKKDFKALLKWRGRARNQLLNRDGQKSHQGDGHETAGEKQAARSEDNVDDEDEDERLRQEIEEKRKILMAKEKRSKKRKAKLRTKAQMRIDLKMDMPGDSIGPEDEMDGFSFSKANKLAKETLVDVDAPGAEALALTEDHISGSLLRSEAADRNQSTSNYEDELEKQLDYLYSEYQSRRKVKQKKEKTQADPENTESSTFEEIKRSRLNDEDSESSSASDSDSESLVYHGAETMPSQGKSERQANIWFTQPLLKSILEPVSEIEESEVRTTNSSEKKRKRGVDKTVSSGFQQEAGSNVDDGEDGFDLSAYDEKARAEIVASAAKMKLMKRRDRHALVDDAYNRYAFDDPSSLPNWFVDEDERSRQRIIPATKEEVEEMKARLRMLEGRPSKKEREAKGRKRMREERRLEKLKQKMSAVAEEGDSSNASKIKAIESLIRKGGKAKKDEGKQYVVATGRGQKKVVGGSSSKGARTKYVDRRMKADRRGIQKAGRQGRKKGRK